MIDRRFGQSRYGEAERSAMPHHTRRKRMSNITLDELECLNDANLYALLVEIRRIYELAEKIKDQAKILEVEHLRAKFRRDANNLFDLIDAFEDKYIPEPNSGCWLWIGARDSYGYGLFRENRAHIFSYRSGAVRAASDGVS
jgi:hypothetical protein